MAFYHQGRPIFNWQSMTWKRKDSSQFGVDSLFCAGKEDNSPLYRTWEPGKYNAGCACCWLGFPHTEKAHKIEIKPWNNNRG